MAEKTIKGRLHFADLGDREAPNVEVEIIEPDGKRRAVKRAKDGTYELPKASQNKGLMLEISAEEGEPRRYTFDSVVTSLQHEGVLTIPQGTWLDWLTYEVCVTGRIQKCWFPFPLGIEASAVLGEIDLGISGQLGRIIDRPTLFEPQIDDLVHFPWGCDPVCQGRVEVYVRECCCFWLEPPFIDPGLVIEDLCDLVPCPLPPGPEPDPVWKRSLEKAAATALKRTSANPDGPTGEKILEATRHLAALAELPSRSAQVEYIRAFPWLWRRFCTCSASKVAEVDLQPDGRFDACFPQSRLSRVGCTKTVQYRVLQRQGDAWVEVYDGLSSGEAFEFDENADLRANSLAWTCDEGIPDPPGTPFVALERAGSWFPGPDNLIHSDTPTDPQDGETSFAPLGASDGLAIRKPAGAQYWAGPYEMAWAKTVSLRYKFCSDLALVGATHYRIRIIPVDGNGNPTVDPNSASVVHTAPLSWQKWEGTDWTWVQLLEDAARGLYKIHYDTYPDPWFGNQFHAVIDTTTLANGRYLFVVDVFDGIGAGANRVEPTNAGGAAGFEYRRVRGDDSDPYGTTAVVPHAALANLFWVDNATAFADIEALSHTGGPGSDENCQFLVGPGSATVALQYEATQSTGFQWHHRIEVKQGLTGPTTHLSNIGWSGSSPAPVPAGAQSNAEMPGGPGSLTVPVRFDDLLAGERRCSYATTLSVLTRHTSGSGRINHYDRHDVAAFALVAQGGPGGGEGGGTP